MARFIQPRYFEPEQIDAISALLDEMAISDDEGRRIFIIALEYELAEYEKSLEGTPAIGDEETPQQPVDATPAELDRLRTTSAQLIGQLQSLPEAMAQSLLRRLQQSDPFQRQYEELYLLSLRVELERLISACGDGALQPTVTPATVMDEAGRQFVLSLAEAFAECFEQDPRAVEASAMHRLLQHIIDSCGLPLQLDQITLQQLLQDQDY